MPFGEGNGTPLQYSCLENPMDGEAWWATVHGVAKSRIWLSNFTFTFHFHALEKEMATHSSVLAWRIPGTWEPGGLPSMGSHRVGHDWSDLAAAAAAECLLQFLSLSLSLFSVFLSTIHLSKTIKTGWHPFVLSQSELSKQWEQKKEILSLSGLGGMVNDFWSCFCF